MIALVRRDELNCLEPFSGAEPMQCQELLAALRRYLDNRFLANPDDERYVEPEDYVYVGNRVVQEYIERRQTSKRIQVIQLGEHATL